MVTFKVKMGGGAEGVSKVDETFDEVEECLFLILCPATYLYCTCEGVSVVRARARRSTTGCSKF